MNIVDAYRLTGTYRTAADSVQSHVAPLRAAIAHHAFLGRFSPRRPGKSGSCISGIGGRR